MHCPPLEICEVVIDDVADDDELTLRNHHLSQLALVCRSWVPRARFHLYRFICIGNGTQFDSFRHSLRILPERCSDIRLLCLWGHRDTNLKKGAIPTTRDSSTKYLRDAVCTLPWRVPHLQRLELGYLPILHPTFIPLCSEFKAVVALSLQHLTHQTAVEIVNIINRFPQLRTLRLVDCQWSRPSQRLPIHLPFLDDLQVELPDVDCRRDCIGWFFPNDSKSGITKLQWSIYEPLGDELVDVLKRSPALRVISLTAVSPKTFCGMWVYAPQSIELTILGRSSLSIEQRCFRGTRIRGVRVRDQRVHQSSLTTPSNQPPIHQGHADHVPRPIFQCFW